MLSFFFLTAFVAVLVAAVVVATVAVATLAAVTVWADAGGAEKAPTEAVSATPPRETRARRDRLTGVLDRISPTVFHLRLPG
ncbi:hypothetical protein GCM10023194_09890 [Planotetraspora phitsanulokensis]|uniref:Uncharacterized protein n=1 Tax=Planotetraspora phitsanulokensis TaxID=575192 RepID=A0A8J3XBQ0_9ACTN|nr:hypothetical protein Pph01_02580 [Planotetraspora phitsanulokensis]